MPSVLKLPLSIWSGSLTSITRPLRFSVTSTSSAPAFRKDNNLRLKDIRDIDDSLQKIREQLKDTELGDKKRQDLRQEAGDLSQGRDPQGA